MLEQILDIILNIAECDNDTCPGVAFTAVGAAFATQGYYLQSAIIGLIGKGGYEMWAVWLYMFSFLVFIIMIVLNGLSIPKNVMWFVLGPALFNWMVYTGTDVKGVGWAIGTKYVDDENQKRVWEIAEPGLRNIDPIKSGELDDTQGAQVNVNRTKVESTIRVAWLFVYWDNIVSGAVAHLADWVGASKLRGGLGTSNLGNKDLSDTTAGAGTSSDSSVEMSILGNLKWGKLQTISQAKISTPALKDAFVEFMTGTCGVELKKWLIVKNITSSKKANWAPTTSVFQTSLSVSNGGGEEAKNIKNAFDQKRIPAIRSLISAFRNDTGGETGAKGTELGKFVKDEIQNVYTETIDKGDAGMTCTNAFMLIITALRWEVGQTYHKLLADIDNGEDSKEDDILATLFYGWRIPSGRDDNFLNSTKSDTDVRVSNSNLKYFTRNLILDYIIKNEVEFIPNFMKTQYSDQKQAEQAADTHIKATGSQGKFGEVYTWARMMPYVQGILMFVLAGAYPIACIIFIIPGCHKVIVTWAAFWAWVKFWDVGFAVVMVIERSLWGMVGNSTKMKALNGAIYGNIDMVGISVRCDEGSLGSCAFPTIESTSTSGTGGGFKNFHNTLNIFDQGLALAGSLNYGVNNGYYVYLMAALYMAVPVICGQVILQGKHGVGSLAGMMTGGAEKAAGGAAEASAKSQHAAAITNTVGTAERQVKADAATKYAMNAMQAGNKAADAGLEQQYRGGYQKGLEAQLGLARNNMNYRKGAQDLVSNGAGMLASAYAAWNNKSSAAMGALGMAGLGALYKNITGRPSGFEQTLGAAKDLFDMDQNGFQNGALAAFNGSLAAEASKKTGQSTNAAGAVGGTGSVVNNMHPFSAGTYDFEKAASMGAHLHGFQAAGYNLDTVLPMERANTLFQSDNNIKTFDLGADQSLQKAYAERQETMARYEGDMAGYDMKRDMAGSMQHIAGVFGVNLMPQQKPYDIKGMMGAGEIGEYATKKEEGSFVFDKENSRLGSDIFGHFGTADKVGGSFGSTKDTYEKGLSDLFSARNISNTVGSNGVRDWTTDSVAAEQNYIAGRNLMETPVPKGLVSYDTSQASGFGISSGSLSASNMRQDDEGKWHTNINGQTGEVQVEAGNKYKPIDPKRG